MAENIPSHPQSTSDLNPQSVDFDDLLEDALMALYGEGSGSVLDMCNDLLKIDAQRSETYALLALVAWQSNDLARAEQLMQKAHDLDPDCQEYADVLATLNTRLGKLTDGLYYAKLATALDGNPAIARFIPPALKDYASALKNASTSIYHLDAQNEFEQRNYHGAIDFCQRHLQAEPNSEPCFRLLGRASIKIGEFDQALSALHAAVHLKPDEALNYAYLGQALNGLGRQYEALACFNHAKDLAPHDRDVHGLVVSGLMSLPDDSWPIFRKINSAWNRKHVVSRAKNRGHKFDPSQGRRIRIGYMGLGANMVSPDVKFLHDVITAHDRSSFELIGYQTFSVEDQMTYAIQNSMDVWCKLKDIDAFTAALIVRNDQCDVLIDCGCFGDNNRMDVLAQRPAPVQIAWGLNGEAVTTPGADYVISDRILHEADEKMCLKDQKPLIVEGGNFALAPFALVSEPSELPAKSYGCVSFGAVVDLEGVNPEVVRIWCKVLRSVPKSRLVFGFTENVIEPVREHIVEMFSHLGMADRVLFHEPDETMEIGPGLTANRQDFFSHIDIFFGGAPMCSASAVAQSLWMGVPAICRNSGRRAARLGASVLASANRHDWIAKSDDEFVSLAVNLAEDVEALSATRASLRDELSRSPLFSPIRFARQLESALLTVLNK